MLVSEMLNTGGDGRPATTRSRAKPVRSAARPPAAWYGCSRTPSVWQVPKPTKAAAKAGSVAALRRNDAASVIGRYARTTLVWKKKG